MPGKAIGMSLPFGQAGTVSRGPRDTIEAKKVNSDSANIPFGSAVVQNADNTVSHPTSVALTTSNFVGIAVAEIKQFNTYISGQNQDQNGFYAADEILDVLEMGNTCVKVAHGTPSKVAGVYVRTVLSSAFPDEVIGDFRADNEAGKCVQLPNASWTTGNIDVNGLAEIKLRFPNI